MSVAITHRPHIHLPWMPIIALGVAAVIATTVLVLINQPSTTSTSETQTGSVAAVGAAAVPMPESPALRRTVMEAAPAEASAPEALAYLRSRVPGVTLGVTTEYVAQPPAPDYMPGEVLTDAHPMNHFAGVPAGVVTQYVVQPPASDYPPGTVSDPRPLNHFAGGPR